MNKILKSLILLPFLLSSFCFVSAAEMDQPMNCCTLKSDVTLDGDLYTKGDTVGDGENCSLQDDGLAPDNTTKQWGLVCILGSVGGISHWIFIALMVVAPLMVMLGAYHIMTAGSDPERVTKGKNYIIWAAVGLVVGLFSNAIPNVISSLIAG